MKKVEINLRLEVEVDSKTKQKELELNVYRDVKAMVLSPDIRNVTFKVLFDDNMDEIKT